MKISTCRLIVLLAIIWAHPVNSNLSAASWISCKLSNEGCVEVLGKRYNRDEVNRIFDICREINDTPVNRFTNTYHADFNGNLNEKMFYGWGLVRGELLYNLGVTFKYTDGGSDPARNKLTLTAACGNWIQASPYSN